MNAQPTQTAIRSVTLPNLTNAIQQIATPPQQRFFGYSKTVNYFKWIYHQSLANPRLVHDILQSLPEIVGVKQSTITLAPAADDRLLEVIREICMQRVAVYRKDIQHDVSPEHYRGVPITSAWTGLSVWSNFTIRNTSRATRILLARSLHHEGACYNGKIYQTPINEARCLHNLVVDDCANMVQCVLDELRSLIHTITTSNRRLEFLPKQPPLVESVDQDGLTIRSNTPIPVDNSILYSGVNEIIERVRRVYSHGDPGGRAAYRYKRKQGVAVINDVFRIEIKTSIVPHTNHIRVHFFHNSQKYPFIIVPCNHNRHLQMTQAEVLQCQKNFAETCAVALQTYFTSIYNESIISGRPADYWRPWLHANHAIQSYIS